MGQILGQQIPLFDEPQRGLGIAPQVLVAAPVAFFDGKARIAGSLPLTSGEGKRDIGTEKSGQFSRASGVRGSEIPAGKGGKRNGDVRQADTGYLISILVHLGLKHRKGLPDLRRFDIHDLLGLPSRTEIHAIRGGHRLRQFRTRYVREVNVLDGH
jgi:hypothetical protein